MSTLKKITIDQLQPGMYVESVAKQKGNLEMKSQGVVSSDKVVAFLREKGVLEVIIDVEKQKQDKPKAPKKPEKPEKPQYTKSSAPLVVFEDEVEKATQIYNHAKSIQKRLLKNVEKGFPVSVGPITQVSESFVASLQRNPNALMCMTHLREKDDYLLEHSLNVGILLASFGRFLGFDENMVTELALAGMLHDIGKVNIPDKILLKPGKLTDPEMMIMKGHVNEGLNALSDVENVSDVVLKVVGQHHERLDGNGYPNMLPEEKISRIGRMVSIVDAYDAMTADRCYKKGMPANHALKILLKNAGTHFDKTLVSQFVKTVGIHPVGTLVKTESNKLALVMAVHEEKPLAPKIKLFYSLRMNSFIPPKEIDMAKNAQGEKIMESVRPEDYDIDYKRFFGEFVCV
ncbi:MAG: HD-GYP domain-containing protein [Aestuariibacter sp.]